MSTVDRVQLEDPRRQLRDGQVIAVPTDTVYGLAVDPSISGATKRLFQVKTRPLGVALPVMVSDLSEALTLSEFRVHRQLIQLGERLWPGSLTIVVPRRLGCDFDLGGDPTTIGLRVSGDPVLGQLCDLVGPLAVSSANLHGQPACTSVSELRESFGEDLFVLDGGRCAGQASTVVDINGTLPRLLREGAITLETILDVLG